MSTFWKPRLRIGPETPQSARTKVLGNMVYVLWCRCDLCFQTGPSTLFTFMERGQETGEICGFCSFIEQNMRDLLADGWKIRE